MFDLSGITLSQCNTQGEVIAFFFVRLLRLETVL